MNETKIAFSMVLSSTSFILIYIAFIAATDYPARERGYMTIFWKHLTIQCLLDILRESRCAGLYLSLRGQQKFKGTYIVFLVFSFHCDNQKPMSPKDEFHCEITRCACYSRCNKTKLSNIVIFSLH